MYGEAYSIHRGRGPLWRDDGQRKHENENTSSVYHVNNSGNDSREIEHLLLVKNENGMVEVVTCIQ